MPKPAQRPNPDAWRLPGFSFEPIGGGARNTVLRGRGAGAKYVFKTTTRDEKQLQWLRHVQAAARVSGLRAALPVPTRFGTSSHDGWTMEPYVEGQPGRPGDLSELAAHMKSFHHAASGTPQRPGFASAHDLIAARTGGDIDLTSMPLNLVQMCRRAWSPLPAQPNTLIHADLNCSNLVIATDGVPVLLDWDEARVDLPLFDHHAMGSTQDPSARAAALAFEIAICWCIEQERAHSLADDLPAAVAAAQKYKEKPQHDAC